MQNCILGIGVEGAKKMLKQGKLKGFIDEDSTKSFVHYKILIENNGCSYTNEYVKHLENEVARLKATMLNASRILIDEKG